MRCMSQATACTTPMRNRAFVSLSLIIELVLLQFYHVTAELRSLFCHSVTELRSRFCHSRRYSLNSRSAMHICVIFQKAVPNAPVHNNQMLSGSVATRWLRYIVVTDQAVLLFMCIVHGLKKNLNSSLPFGQAALRICLP